MKTFSKYLRNNEVIQYVSKLLPVFQNRTLSLKGESRGAKAKRHILYSFGIQGLSILIGLLYVPLLLNYLTQEKYGIWLTLTSILGWFSYFDIGLGNGLRNKLTESIALCNNDLGKKYVSTTYALLIGIFSIVLVIFHICNFFLNWNSILNTQNIDNHELYVLTSIVFTFFILRFVFQLIVVIYKADQKPAFGSLISTFGNLISFIFVLLLTQFTIKGNLVLLGTVISVIPVILLITVSFFAFKKRYPQFSPSFNEIDIKLSHGLLSLGVKFFFLQLTYIFVYSTSNIFVTQFFGPQEVTIYNIAFKYFQLPHMAFSIILIPIWSAVTDAYIKADFLWLKKTLKTLNILSLVFGIGIIVMVFISNWFYELWVGSQISVPLKLSISLGIYSIMQIVILPHSAFLNGIGKIKISLISTSLGMVIYLVLIYILKDIYKDSTAIVMAINCTFVVSAILQISQVHMLLNKKAMGIWNE
ncbi:oligosaccharide flippase family protein [uncultured Draconibacterium sp.]|uniref:lipopolysaccharide biosynthesis protein n=1 Tax=uncultured Draconibacterium sp. TaxID=1573823 RepID=UPI002AA7C8E0|nr:oligosaccharide flippase family protein [uncultured Draconibacterium sp.]